MIGFLLFVAFFALAVNLGKIQLRDHEKFVKLAKSQHYQKISIPARRGLILDRNGNKLAQSLQLSSVYADPLMVKDVPAVAHQLSKILKQSPVKLTKRLKKKKRFVWIKRKISDEEHDAISQLSLQGIGIIPEFQRFYPNGQLASHIIGFTDIDENGLEGVELLFDSHLSGKSGYKLITRDAQHGQIIMPDVQIKLPEYGNNIVLTIDKNIQRIAEEELMAGCENSKPIAATTIVMDVMTGEVLAMANYPTYDPNRFKKYPAKNRKNLALASCYEPGSIMKPIVISGVFEHGVASPSEMVDCGNGVCWIGKRRLRDAHRLGRISVSEVVSQSSNIGMAKLSIRLGIEKMYQHLQNFDFGKKTGIQLPGEISGYFRDKKNWTKEYTLVSISMGHEIAVTPLQFITAFCSIPNGGFLVKPKIIKSIRDSHDDVIESVKMPAIVRRVMSGTVAREIMNPILMEVVTDGTGTKAKSMEYDIAGKTGTSQKLAAHGRGYSQDKYVGSFIGYAPAQNPRICVLVMMDEPRKGSYYGGTVAAPVVKEIIRRTLPYLGVESTKMKMAMQ